MEPAAPVGSAILKQAYRIRVSDLERRSSLPTQTKRVRSRKKDERDSLLTKEFERSRTLRIVSVGSILAIAIFILVGLFAPGLRYSLVAPPQGPVDAQAFLNELEPLVSSKITRHNRIEVIENGVGHILSSVSLG